MARGEERELRQEEEWREAQSIHLTAPDLVSVATSQLTFLSAVDRHRSLYLDGPLLRRAIHRYKNCWLPLLAERSSGSIPLVVPLDCEWIWHCHRLNPVRYEKDCESVFGKILDNRNVESTVSGTKVVDEMVQLWGSVYPGEPFEFDDLEELVSRGDSSTVPDAVAIDYDLVAAIERQSSFYYQVSRPTMRDKRFLEAAVSRYKGFLHLIKRNQESPVKRFSVPTYDIDLIWHSHQLQPLCYCNDLVGLIGRVLEHDDTDSDRSKGQKLDVGFTETRKAWEETFGSRYWRAGAMYRGNSPSPVVTSPYKGASNVTDLPCSYQKQLRFSRSSFIEVLMEVVDARNVPDHKLNTLFISFNKSNRDPFLNGGSTLDIKSTTGKREVAGFRCEPIGDLILTVFSEFDSFLTATKLSKRIGTISISLPDILGGDSELAIEKWFELRQNSRNGGSEPICLHVAVSFTVPEPAPYTYYLVKAPTVFQSTCCTPFSGRRQHRKLFLRFIDENGKEAIRIFSRFLRNKNNQGSDSRQQVVGFLNASREEHVLAEVVGNAWTFIDSKFVLSFDYNKSKDGHVFGLQSEHPIKLYPGQRLEFEDKTCSCRTQNDERDFITAVRFSVDEPYGKALALVNIKTGLLKVHEEWFVLPGLVLTFILWSTLKTKGGQIFIFSDECFENISETNAKPTDLHEK